MLKCKFFILNMLVLQTSLEIFLSINFGQFLGVDGPYLALLGPLLAPPASALTPLTCGNPVSTQLKQVTIFVVFLRVWP